MLQLPAAGWYPEDQCHVSPAGAQGLSKASSERARPHLPLLGPRAASAIP